MRRMLATLSDRGRVLVERASPECEAVNVAIRAAMGNERMVKLQALLAQLEKRIGTLDLSDVERPVLEAGIAAPAKQRGRPRKVPVSTETPVA
jgi:hypothetical protein